MKKRIGILTVLVLVLTLFVFIQTACAGFSDMWDGKVIRPGENVLIQYTTGYYSWSTKCYARISAYEPDGHLVHTKVYEYHYLGENLIDEDFIPEKEGQYRLEGYCFIRNNGEQVMTDIQKFTLNSIRKCETGAHQLGEWSVNEEPTCTREGWETATCSKCFETVWRKIPAKGHDLDNPVVIRAATCSATGLKIGQCKVCGETVETEIPIDPDAHDWEDAVYDWAADYSRVTGSRKCRLNHEHDATETVNTTSAVTRQPTYAAMGETTYTAVFTKACFTTQIKKVNNIPQLVPKGVALSSLKAGKQELTVKWKAGTDINGYEIEYSLKKNFKGSKNVEVTKAKTTSAVLKGLKAKKTYYVRIRTFKKVGGKKYYSEWSKAKSKKTK